MNKILLLFFIAFSFSNIHGQFITESGDTLYGNEWIKFDQDYYKIPVAEDGIYRVAFQELEAAGIPVSTLKGENFQFYHNGKAYPVYVSNSGDLSGDDYIEFYGRKNRGELDEIFYEDPETMQLNPEYSLFTDTSAYFLTWNTGSNNLRVKEVFTDFTGSSAPLLDHYIHKERIVRSNRIHKPTRNGADNVRFSHFDIGEGFGSNLAQTNTITVGASEVFESGADPFVDIRFTSNGTAHEFDFSINGEKYATWKHSAYVLRQEQVTFPMTNLKSSNSVVLEGQVDQFDRNVIAIVDLNYPRTFNFENRKYFEFFMPASSDEKRIEISNFNGGSNPIIYDPATGSRIIPEEVNGNLGFILPSSTIERNLIIYHSEDVIQSVIELENIEFVDYSEKDHDYIIISHPKLMNGPVNKVQEYADYRSSSAGGGFNPIVINVEELYEQFSYGVHRHSYSVKNFVNWASRNWSTKFVFIIGKGREYATYRTASQINHEDNADFTVPTYGYPGSDNLLVSNGNNSAFALAGAGRLVATNADEIALYKDKIIVHEAFKGLPQTIDDKFWTKKIVHLSGGDPNIQEFLFNSLEAMRSEIESNQFAGSVETIRKYSSDIIQTSLSEGILEIINEGVAMMTFFGHSAVGTFDFSIEDPSTYENKDKYPVMISLGCHSGNIHTSSEGVSEDFVIERDKGAIAFLASSGSAYISAQRQFGVRLYDFLGTEYYGKSFGEALRQVIKTWDKEQSIHTKILMEQLTFHGDPAIKLQHFEAPDLIVDKQKITTVPDIVSATIDSFQFEFDVVNLGRNSNVDSVDIALMHYLPDGELFQEIVLREPTPNFRSTYAVSLLQPGLKGLGKNEIEIVLDSGSAIEEGPSPEGENNNVLSYVNSGEKFSFFILDKGAIPIYPEQKSIINSECPFELKASTNNLFLDNQDYIFQIDTSGNFTSPFLKEKKVSAKGGVISWSPEFVLENGLVYYWRISPDSISPEAGFLWENSSFLYLENGNLGWNTSHYYQFLDSEKATYLQTDERVWEFVREKKDIRFDLGLSTTPGNWVFQNGQPFGSLNPENFNSYLGILAKTPYSFSISNSDPDAVGSLPTPAAIFGYYMDKLEDRQNVSELIRSFPDDTRVFIYTIIREEDADLHVEDWESDSLVLGYNLFSVLEDLGAEKVRDLSDKGTVPYLFIYDVGKGPVVEIIGDDIYSEIEVAVTADLFAREGVYKTHVIGPASKWDKLIWKDSHKEGMDSMHINILGIDGANEVYLYENVTENEFDLSNLDVKQYERIKLELVVKDFERSAPSLDYMRVLFDGVPDFALNANSDDFIFNRDTLNQGETLVLQVPVENYTGFETDSIEATFKIITAENKEFVETRRFAPVDAKGESIVRFERNSSDLQGDNLLLFNVNTVENEVEKYTNNNLGIRNFYVRNDEKNPILDVMIDGVKILNGDIVSPSPQINITLKDENQYLLLEDPNSIEIAIRDTEGNVEKIMADDPRVDFSPAISITDNTATFTLTPTFTKDGEYTLTVNGADASENKSGSLNYEVSFNVYLDEKISDVLNYPNPFSTSTQFVFTLTGIEVPSDLKITIMTTTGKVVKEIFKEELGPLRIGINRTQYRWDGTDDFGNRLANGIYLYRVKATDSSGEDTEKLSTSTSQFFKNNLGKLVILR